MPNWLPFRATVRRPDPDKDDPGQIEEGKYRLHADGLLEVEDATGRPMGSSRIGPNDDPLVAARKSLRERHGKHLAFGDRIRYPVRGIV
jgi:hypothetical protein